MKTLIFFRHAKSSWDHDVIDHERPLNKRGVTDAHNMGQFLAKENCCPLPDQILVSDSKRTTDTSDIILSYLPVEVYPQFVRDLYDFSGEWVMDVINQTEDSVNTLMVFGHNNALTHLVNALTEDYLEHLPTGGMVIMSFNTNNWSNISEGSIIKTVFPKALRE